jgi:hypothetical protein
VKTQAGYYGNYKVYVAPLFAKTSSFSGEFKNPILGIDNRIGLDILSRSDVAASNRQAAGGFGLFLLDRKTRMKS